MKTMKKNSGGLIKELEEKIKASDELLALYENNCIVLELRNKRLNEAYSKSYNLNWLKMNYQLNLTNINLIELRQSMIETICNNNDLIEKYKNNLFHQTSINSFFKKLYFYLNKTNKFKKRNLI